MKKALFIYCPAAGNKEITSHLDYIFNRYQAYGYILQPYRYGYNDDLNVALKHIDQSYEHILIAGGDGTLNRVITAMKNNNINIPIGILPSGTANDFAKMLGINQSLKTACEQILNGDTVNVDLGIANDKYFINVLSTGLFTDVSKKTPTYLKNTFGKLAYYVGGVQELPNFKKMRVKIIGDNIYFDDTALILFVFNGRTAGNFPISKSSSVTDGLLDVIIVKADSFGDSVLTALHFVTGSTKKYPKGVIHFKTSKLEIEFEEQTYFDVDGEMGPCAPLKVECLKENISVIIPKNCKHKLTNN